MAFDRLFQESTDGRARLYAVPSPGFAVRHELSGGCHSSPSGVSEAQCEVEIL